MGMGIRMIRITQLKLPVSHTEADLKEKAEKILKLNRYNGKCSIVNINIRKRSIDARKKPELYYIYTIDVELSADYDVGKLKNSNVCMAKLESYKLPKPGNEKINNRPIIIGMGPAGMFAGLMLSKAGFNPLILERGDLVERRIEAVNRFWETGILDTSSNVQFGEGGAGTFSDGKLNTLVKDAGCRNKKVLETFVEAGASSDILYVNKPHIGTDVLRKVVKNIRKQILDLGGEIKFGCVVTDFLIEHGKIIGVQVNNNEVIAGDIVILAIGHSARDTFYKIWENKINIRSKSFAVGLRIEHPQNQINLAQYGVEDLKKIRLGAADYKVTKQTSTGRGVYSFCMCPGGYVVNAASEQGKIAINGMSYHMRDSKNANAALIVTVTPNDFCTLNRKTAGEISAGGGGIDTVKMQEDEIPDALLGMEFQRQLESSAYRVGNGKIPVQLLGDFRENRVSRDFGDVMPCIKGQYKFGSLREVLPDYISNSIIEGIESFDHMIKDFDRYDAILSGVESRTSSPVRIERNEDFQSNIKGLYPCGEGAGYAGGIMSAAMDGIKVAEAVVSRYKLN